MSKTKQTTEKAQVLSEKKTRLYDVLVSPLVTEKSTAQSSENRYSFVCAKNATKEEIKSAVEVLFKVKVIGLNTLNHKGKTKRFRGVMGQQSNTKKAIVRLAKGQTIDVGAGL